MPKRNITHKRGKQLYLNKMFLRGMLYTSSEMEEGYVKIIDNFDITPTGDSAVPRASYKELPIRNTEVQNKYIVPVKFKDFPGDQTYIYFNDTIDVDTTSTAFTKFAEEDTITLNKEPIKTIKGVTRSSNALNTSTTIETIPLEYYQTETNITETETETETESATPLADITIDYSNNKAVLQDNSEEQNRIEIDLNDCIESLTPDIYLAEDIVLEIPVGFFEDYKTNIIHDLHRIITDDGTNYELFNSFEPDDNDEYTVHFYLTLDEADTVFHTVFYGEQEGEGSQYNTWEEILLDGELVLKDTNNSGSLEFEYKVRRILRDSKPVYDIVENSENILFCNSSYNSITIKASKILKTLNYINKIDLKLNSNGKYVYITGYHYDSNIDISLQPLYNSYYQFLHKTTKTYAEYYFPKGTSLYDPDKIRFYYGYEIPNEYTSMGASPHRIGHMYYDPWTGLLERLEDIPSSAFDTLNAEYANIRKELESNSSVPFYKYNVFPSICFDETECSGVRLRQLQAIINNARITNLQILKVLYYYLVQENQGLAVPKKSTYIPAKNITVYKDGDSFVYNDTEYRLNVVNSVEMYFKWYRYTKEAFKNILENLCKNAEDYNNDIYAIGNSKDIYTRTLTTMYKYYNKMNDSILEKYGTNAETGYINRISVFKDNKGNSNNLSVLLNHLYSLDYININKLLLATGLYNIEPSAVNNTTSVQLEDYIKIFNKAEENKYFRYDNNGETFIDPYFTITIAEPSKENTMLKISDTMYIQALTLQGSYNISAISNTKYDDIETIYVDYLDAIGFLGRIIEQTSDSQKVIYKGIILVKPLINSDGSKSLQIMLPYNKGDGQQPDVIKGAVEGYNLYNKEMLHVNSTEDSSQALQILGLAITDPKITTPNIITQAYVGQKVNLKAILNKGIYNRDSKFYHDTKLDYVFDFCIDSIIVTANIDGTNKEVNITNKLYYNINSSEKTSLYIEEKISNLLTDAFPDTSPENIKITNIKFTYYARNLTINSNYFYAPNTEQVSSKPITEGVNAYSSVLFDDYRYPIDTIGKYYINISSNISFTKTNEQLITHIYININDNFKDPLENIYPKVYCRWSLINDNTITPISDDKLLLEYNDDSAKYVYAPGNPEYFNGYMIVSNKNASFRFDIIPKVEITLSDLNRSKIFLENTFDNMYQVYPNLTIDNSTEVITTADLKKNIDIKNATRIAYFNRQIILYGEHIGSNILQFSKFEKFDYYPLNFGTLELPEKIIHVANFKDSLVIFGLNNIYMLTGGITLQECSLYKIYENLSCKLSDIKLIKAIGNNLMFFNNGTGYIIVPNVYVDSVTNIKIYKLTENISNFFFNPEEYIRIKLSNEKDIDINVDSVLRYEMMFDSYIENNTINIIDNITINVNGNANKYYLTVIFIYNQDYKYWKMYSLPVSTKPYHITNTYISEPNYNHQYLIYRENDSTDKSYNIGVYSNIDNEADTILHTGYLSVDTVNDKRFKDVILEFDKLNANTKLDFDFNFLVDNKPITLSNDSILIKDAVDETDQDFQYTTGPNYTKSYTLEHISNGDSEVPDKQTFGSHFQIDNDKMYLSGRSRIRIPVYGKGRLPSFVLKTKSNGYYEFVNYSLVYKEKNLNRRS